MPRHGISNRPGLSYGLVISLAAGASEGYEKSKDKTMSDSTLRTAIARALHDLYWTKHQNKDGAWCEGNWLLSKIEREEYLEEADAVLKVLADSALPGKTSDGHHTFDELYEYRMLYNAHAVKAWLFAGIPVVKSWRHSDGEECFGGGWFIVTAQLPSGQVSNHYRAEHWSLFVCPSVERAPEWDGHSSAEAARRLLAALVGGEQDD